MCACTWRPEVGQLPQSFPVLLFETESLANLVRLVSWRARGILLSPPPDLQEVTAVTWLYFCLHAKDLNSCPHAFIFPTESFPSPQNTTVIMSKVCRK